MMMFLVLSPTISVSPCETLNNQLLFVALRTNTKYMIFFAVGGISVETGSSIRTTVLDVSKIERLVDLSLKPAFVNKSKKQTTNNQAQKVILEIAISLLCCNVHSLSFVCLIKDILKKNNSFLLSY